MAKRKPTDEAPDEFANEGPLAGVEDDPVERPYDEARDPKAFSAEAHHGYAGEPGNVVDLTDNDAEPAPEADTTPSE